MITFLEKRFTTTLFFIIIFLLLFGKITVGQNEVKSHYPEWAKKAVIYEVNIRQHSADGKFTSIMKDLPRLKQLGVDVLWLMPVYPIGDANRKGVLGNPYSVKNFHEVNPEFGTKEDFRLLINIAHTQGFKVILDWVAGFTSGDNVWTSEHIDWYKKDNKGNIISPNDWTDVVSLDYKNPDMRKAMIEAMEYWLKEFNIDGFRCEKAGSVPKDFWEDARESLEKIKPVLMLAEDEDNFKLLNKAFDVNYNWKLRSLMSKVAKAESKPWEIIKLQMATDSLFPKDAIKLNFVTNHDENAWNGTLQEQYNEGIRAMTLLTFTLPGMPMIYSGQEIGLNKRLKFYDKDTISWSNNPDLTEFYKKLANLRHTYQAMWSPPYGGTFKAVWFNGQDHVMSFARISGKQKILVIINMSRVPTSIKMTDKDASGDFTEYFTTESKTLGLGSRVDLPAWGYKVLIKR